ncbi:efflux RND transporter periplasmic adaptor subunit [candidate division KSB1 bacterium]
MDRKIKKKKFTPKRIAGAVLILAFMGLISYPLFFERSGTKLNVETERITISTVRMGPFLEFIPITGAIVPIKTIFLDAIEGGQVKEIYLDAGSFVNKGDHILELENTNLLLDIMNREAQFVEQQNFLRNTRLQMEVNNLSLRRDIIDNNYHLQRLKREYERQEELFNNNVASKQEYERAKDEYEYYLNRSYLMVEKFKTDSLMREVQVNQLETSLTRMESNLEFVKKKQENLILKAPISGQLTSLVAEVGQSIGMGQRFGQIDVLDGFKVRAGIDEFYITRIEIGQTATFALAEREYDLIVDKIYPEVRNNRFEVELSFVGESPVDIRRGMTLHIQLALSDLSQAVLLPNRGFFQKTGGNWVFLIEPSGDVASKRFIKLGRKNVNDFEVLEGLEPGDLVITSSYDNFGDADILILKN